jgi:hypothetical protein
MDQRVSFVCGPSSLSCHCTLPTLCYANANGGSAACVCISLSTWTLLSKNSAKPYVTQKSKLAPVQNYSYSRPLSINMPVHGTVIYSIKWYSSRWPRRPKYVGDTKYICDPRMCTLLFMLFDTMCECYSVLFVVKYIWVKGQNTFIIYIHEKQMRSMKIVGYESRWLCGLRHRYAAAWLLGLWVRITLRAWMFVFCVCCVLRR